MPPILVPSSAKCIATQHQVSIKHIVLNEKFSCGNNILRESIFFFKNIFLKRSIEKFSFSFRFKSSLALFGKKYRVS